MDAPLYQALAALAKKDSLRMHMPGHTAPRPAAHRQPLPTADSSDIMDQQTCLKYLKTQM